MKNIVCLTFVVIITFLTLNVLIDICEARGGRGGRGGGGAFGGMFGGWRKYKKPNGGNSRRTISGSPMHTTATKSIPSGASSHSTSMKETKSQMSYPKQQMPQGTGYNAYGGYYGNGAGTPPLPPGSTYYPSMGAMPQGAIYYPQSMHSSSGSSNFLYGMLAGHMTSSMLLGPRHHVTHVHQHNLNSDQAASQNGGRIIVVNNGEVQVLNTTGQSGSSPAAYWPTDTDTPLEPFNDTVTAADAQQPGKNPYFQRIKFNNSQNAQMTQAAHQQPTSNVQSTPSTSTAQDPPVNGIICLPLLLNETHPDDPSQVHQVERVICFPAPPPTATSSPNCVTRILIVTDPNDPSKTIEVPKEICTTPTTTSEPRQVAGEIDESLEDINPQAFLPSEEEEDTPENMYVVDSDNTQEIAITETAANGKSSESIADRATEDEN